MEECPESSCLIIRTEKPDNSKDWNAWKSKHGICCDKLMESLSMLDSKSFSVLRLSNIGADAAIFYRQERLCIPGTQRWER